jgi:hypothetical protein
VVLVVFGVWVGTATAHQLRGWRTALLPVLYLVIVVVGVTFLEAVRRGVAFAWNSVLIALGIPAG